MSALFTDLYQLTMMAGYYASGLTGLSTFELFVRHLPPRRSVLVVAGLDQALDYLENLTFTRPEIEYLRGLPIFSRVPREFFDDYLPAFRFTGEVWAAPEGTPIVPPAPFLRVTAPAPEAQVVETALLAILTFQTSIASKAARLVEASAGRQVIEFGSRRAHGLEAGLYAARGAMIGGCVSTSNVEAGLRFRVPVTGTMAHSWVLTFEDELESFRRFSALYGGRTVLLIDTYDTLSAAARIVGSGLRPSAVRLDSGNITALSREVRRILDAGGLFDTRILASGDLDEDQIARIVSDGAPVDGFGVGTSLSTSSDAPALGGVYKLVEVERGGLPTPVMKLSEDKRTVPGRKQVWRIFERGEASYDVIGSATEVAPAGGEPLLARVMSGGRREAAAEPVAAAQARCRLGLSKFPASVRRLTHPAAYEVRLSDELARLAEALERRGGELPPPGTRGDRSQA
jgi:nicotinate phosphoribosyltransferase